MSCRHARRISPISPNRRTPSTAPTNRISVPGNGAAGGEQELRLASERAAWSVGHQVGGGRRGLGHAVALEEVAAGEHRSRASTSGPRSARRRRGAAEARRSFSAATSGTDNQAELDHGGHQHRHRDPFLGEGAHHLPRDEILLHVDRSARLHRHEGGHAPGWWIERCDHQHALAAAHRQRRGTPGTDATATARCVRTGPERPVVPSCTSGRRRRWSGAVRAACSPLTLGGTRSAPRPGMSAPSATPVLHAWRASPITGASACGGAYFAKISAAAARSGCNATPEARAGS